MSLNLNKEDISILNSEIFNTVYETLDNGKSIYGIDYVDGQSITGLWYTSNRVRSDNFFKRRDAFLWILERLLREGRIKLHKNGIFFDSSIEDQIKAFRQVWPETDNPYPDHPDADFYLWFYDPECPAGIAWRKEDGSYEIAD